MNDFLRKLMGFSIGPILAALLSIIIIPVTTYFILPSEFGKSSLFSTVQSILVAVSYLGLDQAFVVYYYDESNKVKLYTNSIILPLIVIVISFLVLPLFIGDISFMLFNSSEYHAVIIGLFSMVPFIVISKFVLLSLRMENKALEYSLASILVNFATFIITLIFVLFIRRDFLAIVYSAIIGQILASIILIVVYRKYIKFSFKLFDKTLFSKLLKYGLPFIVTVLVGWALNSMDQIFLRYFSTYEELGFYTLAMRLSNMLLVIQTSFSSFWTPTYFKWNKDGVPQDMFDKVSQGLSCVMSIMLLSILLFKGLIPILISNTYENSVYILPFLLFYPLFFTMSETTSCGIFLKKKANVTIVIAVGAMITNLALNFLLVPTLGGKGAAIATGISYLVFFWLRTILSRKLWYKFDIWRFVIITIVMFSASLVNMFVYNTIAVSIINVIFIFVILFIHKDIIFYFLKNRKLT